MDGRADGGVTMDDSTPTVVSIEWAEPYGWHWATFSDGSVHAMSAREIETGFGITRKA